MANDTTPASFTPTDFQNAPSTSTPITEAELDKLGTQAAVGIAWAKQRLRFRGAFAPSTPYLENDLIINNGILYRARVAHTSAGTGPDADGDPTYWEVILTSGDPSTFAPDSITFAQVSGLDEALAARLPVTLLATEATPIPANTPDPSLIVVLEP